MCCWFDQAEKQTIPSTNAAQAQNFAQEVAQFERK